MYRKVLISGVTAAVIVGAGTAALATTGSDTPSTTPSNPSSSSAPAHSKAAAGKKAKAKGKGKDKLLRHAVTAQIVTKGKSGYVTHDMIKGTVSSVSATSITVVASNKKSETFTVTKDTKVRARSNGKGAASTISKVVKGDRVLVAGTGTSTLTALHVVDAGKKK